MKVVTKTEDFYKQGGVIREIIGKYVAIVKLLETGKNTQNRSRILKYFTIFLLKITPCKNVVTPVVNSGKSLQRPYYNHF